MFNNLIESTSHAKEFRRRGSFLLFTTATYVVLFVVTGVISIYAYDAHLESQSTEWEVTIMPVIPQPPAPEVVRNTIHEPPTTNNHSSVSVSSVSVAASTSAFGSFGALVATSSISIDSPSSRSSTA